MQFEADVIVVGGGPVGLTLACELRLAGVDVLLLERRTERVAHSRSLGMHGRTLEMLGLRGKAQVFREHSYAFGAGHLAALDTRLDFSALDTQYGVNLVIPQSVTEQLLEQWARELGVRLLRGALVATLTQDEQGVTVQGQAGGAAFSARVPWLAGADGGRSLVRNQAGIAFEGYAASVSAITGDVKLGRPLPGPAYTAVTGEGVLMMLPLGDGVHHRVVLLDARHCDAALNRPVTLEEVADGASRVSGVDWQMSDPLWLSRFSDETRLAAQYRKGRVLLAGDAAHIHMPAGGQGMNVGMQDAFNLGWKLAGVIRGEAGPQLLDSYHAERHPVGQRLMENTLAQTALLTAWDARGLALRDMMSGLLKNPATNRDAALAISAFGVRYPASLSTAPAGYGLLSDWTGRRMPEQALEVAGDAQVSLHARLREGGWLYLRLHDAAPMAPSCQGRVKTLRVRLPAPAPGLEQALAILLRPDGYVDYALAAA